MFSFHITPPKYHIRIYKHLLLQIGRAATSFFMHTIVEKLPIMHSLSLLKFFNESSHNYLSNILTEYVIRNTQNTWLNVNFKYEVYFYRVRLETNKLILNMKKTIIVFYWMCTKFYLDNMTFLIREDYVKVVNTDLQMWNIYTYRGMWKIFQDKCLIKHRDLYFNSQQ